MDNRGNLAETDDSIDIGQVVRHGTVIKLDKAEQDAFFEFYKEARSNTRYFEVTFLDRSVKYFDFMYLDVS